MADPVVHPLGIEVLREYLLSRPEITSFVGARISTSMPPSTASPRWPAIRHTDLNTVIVVPRRWGRMLLQVDYWATTQRLADQGGRVVVAVLQETANFITADRGAVLGEATDLVLRTDADESLAPSQPRSIITCHLPVRPNP